MTVPRLAFVPAGGSRVLQGARVLRGLSALRAASFLLAAASALLAQPALACPMCFGDPSSDMVKGAKIGVAFLLVVVVGVLVGIAGVARSWARRAAALDAAEQPRSGAAPSQARLAQASAAQVAHAGAAGAAAVSPRAVPAAPQH